MGPAESGGATDYWRLGNLSGGGGERERGGGGCLRLVGSGWRVGMGRDRRKSCFLINAVSSVRAICRMTLVAF